MPGSELRSPGAGPEGQVQGVAGHGQRLPGCEKLFLKGPGAERLEPKNASSYSWKAAPRVRRARRLQELPVHLSSNFPRQQSVETKVGDGQQRANHNGEQQHHAEAQRANVDHSDTPKR